MEMAHRNSRFTELNDGDFYSYVTLPEGNGHGYVNGLLLVRYIGIFHEVMFIKME